MSTRGLTATGVPPFPSWLIFVKLAIFGFSLIILILSAYAASLFGGSPGFLIFIALKTLLVFGATIGIERFAPQLFFRIFLLVAYILGIIFWLSAWAWAASNAAFWLSYGGVYHYYGAQAGALAACAGLGALVWILSIVHLVFFVKACLSDSPANAPVPLQGGPELGHAKPDEAAGQYGQPQYAQPAPYGGEQYAPQQQQQQQYAAPTEQYANQTYAAPEQYPQQQYPAQTQQPYASQ